MASTLVTASASAGATLNFAGVVAPAATDLAANACAAASVPASSTKSNWV